MNVIVKRCSEKTGYSVSTLNRILETFFDEMVADLARGRTVDLGEHLGEFVVKLKNANARENTPRTPKLDKYKIVFKESKAVKLRLRELE